MVSTLLLAPACGMSDEKSEEVPENARLAVRTIGVDSRVLGGLQISESVRSFVSGLKDGDGREFRLDDEDREFLTRFGLNFDRDQFSVFAGASDISPDARAGVVIFAPIDAAKMDEMVDSSDRAERVVGTESMYRIQAHSGSVFLSIPESGPLLLAHSPESLDGMLSRMAQGRDLPEDPLLSSIASADAWLLVKDVASLLDRVTLDRLPRFFSGMMGAVATVGGSASVQMEQLVVDLFLEPQESLATKDLSDVLRGAIAAVSLMKNVPQELLDILRGIEISGEENRVRAHLSITRENVQAILLLIQDRIERRARSRDP